MSRRGIRTRLIALTGATAFIAFASACGVVGNNGVERIAPPGALLATVPSSTDPTTSEAATSTSGAATTTVAAAEFTTTAAAAGGTDVEGCEPWTC